MTDADVLADAQLFSTLDPTTRRASLRSGQAVLITDTVGFIQARANLSTCVCCALRANTCVLLAETANTAGGASLPQSSACWALHVMMFI